VDSFTCVSDLFEGRHPIDDKSWRAAASKIISFLSDSILKKPYDQRTINYYSNAMDRWLF